MLVMFMLESEKFDYQSYDIKWLLQITTITPILKLYVFMYIAFILLSYLFSRISTEVHKDWL